jgi:hypothetical protein
LVDEAGKMTDNSTMEKKPSRFMAMLSERKKYWIIPLLILLAVLLQYLFSDEIDLKPFTYSRY